MLTSFSHVMLYVNDVARAAQWYGDTLGFQTRFIVAPHYGILWHDGMKLRLDLHPDRAKKNVGCGAITYFVAADLDGAVASLRAKGVEVENPRTEGNGVRFTSFKDCEGNILGLCEPDKH